ncbi:MAG: hypothetical protein AB7E31_16325 [Desulfitobacterium sp.]
MKKFLSNPIFHLVLIVFISMLLSPIPVFASVEDGGMRIYKKLARIGKWAIVIKGAIDVIQSAMNGDYQNAKQQFMGYLLCFALLLALPYGLTEIEDAFGYGG